MPQSIDGHTENVRDHQRRTQEKDMTQESNEPSGASGGSIAMVRLCCGERHYGPMCPDGMVMCCICFGRFGTDQLNRSDDGQLEDVCKECAGRERAVAKALGR